MQPIACSSTPNLDRLNALNHSYFSQGLLPRYHILMRSATCLLLCPLSDISAHSPFGTSYYDSTSKDTGLNRLYLLRVLHSIYITFFIGLSPDYDNDNLPSQPLLTLTITLSTCEHSRPIARLSQGRLDLLSTFCFNNHAKYLPTLSANSQILTIFICLFSIKLRH